ncbi:MAG: ATP phosphoribosyltransferase [Cyanophyceae cyanobacterium]
MLTVALPKGALLADSINLFKQVGLDFSGFLEDSNRQLQICDPTQTAKALLVRTHDVPIYVEYGQAQLGISSHDILQEKRPQVAKLADLRFGYCRLSVAVRNCDYHEKGYTSSIKLPPHGKVASKFVGCAKEHFRSLNLPVEIVPLYGSVELGPITGMSEAIVDLVSTGRTLKENDLKEIDVLFETTARLIAHPLSYRLNTNNVSSWAEKIRRATTIAH